MIEVIEKKVMQPVSGLFKNILEENCKQCEYLYFYTLKIVFHKPNVIKWSKAQRHFSSQPMDSSDEEQVINKHIKPGLDIGMEKFNKGSLYDRRIDLITVCRDEIAALFLLSCRDEQSVDDIANKLNSLAKRLFILEQFNRFSDSSAETRLIKFFTVHVKKIDKNLASTLPY